MIVDTKFYISASTEATEMYHLSNFLVLRDQSIGAVLEYTKEMLYAIFIENVKYDIYWRKMFMLSCPIIQILSAEFLKNAYN